jgi:tripartite-type tricarboxylate transporter receptor subunit TctC
MAIRILRALALPLMFALSTSGHAADLPDKPIQIVVAYPPGSTMDNLARMLATELQGVTGSTFVVMNRPGAAGQLGAEYVAKAAPDGTTLLITGSSSHSANPALFKTLRYDPVKDFTHITHIASLGYALVVNGNSPVKNIAELAAHAKSKPGGLSYAYGSQLGQIAAAAIAKMAGITAVGVPYKGQPPAMMDLIGGQVDFMIADVPVLVPQIKNGRLRAIAVLNKSPSPLLPSVPTLAEQGLREYDLQGWIGLSGPANMRPPTVKAFADAMAKVLSKPSFRAQLSGMGMEYEPNTPASFTRLVEEQLVIWAKKVRDVGIQAE